MKKIYLVNLSEYDDSCPGMGGAGYFQDPKLIKAFGNIGKAKKWIDKEKSKTRYQPAWQYKFSIQTLKVS